MIYPLISFRFSYLIILVFLFIIYLLITRKKHERTLYDSSFLIIVFIYLISVFSFVFLPFPIQSIVIENKIIPEQNNNFIPFISTIEIFSNWELVTSELRLVINNLLLLIPFGFFLPYLPKMKNVKFTNLLLIATSFSLFIEISQVLLSFIIKYAYRSFDVDDIIFNVTGAILGFCLGKVIDKRFFKNESFKKATF